MAADLPPEILERVVVVLVVEYPEETLSELCLVCKRFNYLSSNSHFWLDQIANLEKAYQEPIEQFKLILLHHNKFNHTCKLPVMENYKLMFIILNKHKTKENMLEKIKARDFSYVTETLRNLNKNINLSQDLYERYQHALLQLKGIGFIGLEGAMVLGACGSLALSLASELVALNSVFFGIFFPPLLCVTPLLVFTHMASAATALVLVGFCGYLDDLRCEILPEFLKDKVFSYLSSGLTKEEVFLPINRALENFSPQ